MTIKVNGITCRLSAYGSGYKVYCKGKLLGIFYPQSVLTIKDDLAEWLDETY